jgi:hypothetical protein
MNGFLGDANDAVHRAARKGQAVSQLDDDKELK